VYANVRISAHPANFFCDLMVICVLKSLYM
jgi:hypothetical protein